MRIINEVANLANARVNDIILGSLIITPGGAKDRLSKDERTSKDFEVLPPEEYNGPIGIRHKPTGNVLQISSRDFNTATLYINGNPVRGMKDIYKVDLYTLLTTRNTAQDEQWRLLNSMSPKYRMQFKKQKQQMPSVVKYNKIKADRGNSEKTHANQVVIGMLKDFNYKIAISLNGIIEDLCILQQGRYVLLERKLELGKIKEEDMPKFFVHDSSVASLQFDYLILVEKVDSEFTTLIIDYSKLVGSPYFGLILYKGMMSESIPRIDMDTVGDIGHISSVVDSYRTLKKVSIATVLEVSKFIAVRRTKKK